MGVTCAEYCRRSHREYHGRLLRGFHPCISTTALTLQFLWKPDCIHQEWDWATVWSSEIRCEELIPGIFCACSVLATYYSDTIDTTCKTLSRDRRCHGTTTMRRHRPCCHDIPILQVKVHPCLLINVKMHLTLLDAKSELRTGSSLLALTRVLKRAFSMINLPSGSL